MVQSTAHGSMKRASKIRRFRRLVKANGAMVFAANYIVKHRKWECMITELFLHPKAQREPAPDATLEAVHVRQQRQTVIRGILLVM